jgi:hypothetical protein
MVHTAAPPPFVPPPFNPDDPIVYSEKRGRMLTAGLTGVAAATATGATHGVLTTLITIRQIRRAIAEFKQAGAKLQAAVNASAMVAAEKQAIKTKMEDIKTALITLETNINSAKQRAAKLEDIKTQLEAIKTVLVDRLSTEYGMAWQTYAGAEAASNSADRMKIGQQSVVAALAVLAIVTPASYFARPIQKTVTQFVDNLRGGVGFGGDSGICTSGLDGSVPECGTGMA